MSPRAKAIIRETAQTYGVEVSEIMGRRRTSKVAFARQMAMAAIRALDGHHGHPAYSLPQIGRMFDRDHSTVHHALKRAAGLKRLRGTRKAYVAEALHA